MFLIKMKNDSEKHSDTILGIQMHLKYNKKEEQLEGRIATQFLHLFSLPSAGGLLYMFALPIMSISSNIPPSEYRASLTSEILCPFWRLPTLTSHLACVHSVCCCCSGHQSNSLSIISLCLPLPLSVSAFTIFLPSYIFHFTHMGLSFSPRLIQALSFVYLAR